MSGVVYWSVDDKYLHYLERPEPGNQEGTQDPKYEAERCAHAKEIVKGVLSGSIDHRVGLVSNGRHEAR